MPHRLDSSLDDHKHSKHVHFDLRFCHRFGALTLSLVSLGFFYIGCECIGNFSSVSRHEGFPNFFPSSKDEGLQENYDYLLLLWDHGKEFDVCVLDDLVTSRSLLSSGMSVWFLCETAFYIVLFFKLAWCKISLILNNLSIMAWEFSYCTMW